MATSNFTLKLLVDKKGNRVLFGEAGKEVVDFLFSLLSLPLGCVIKLLNKDKMVGCLGNLYGSVENLNDTYVLPNQTKESLLNPKPASPVTNFPLLMSNEKVTKPTYYRCSNQNSSPRCYSCPQSYVTDGPGVTCPNRRCGESMSTVMNFIASDEGASEVNTGGDGFVKGVVTYMVFDDLVVSPMSTISSITLLNKFNINNVCSLEEQVVDFGVEEGLALLLASLETKNVLSHVFLGENAT